MMKKIFSLVISGIRICLVLLVTSTKVLRLKHMFGVGDKGMWKINKVFINNQLAARNLPVLISQPVSYSYYAKEIAYLIGKGIIIPL